MKYAIFANGLVLSTQPDSGVNLMNRVSLRVFYLLKPMLPRPLQIALRRHRARLIMRNIQGQTVASELGALRPNPKRWPDGARSCVLLTHDVETATGLDGIEPLRELEREHGLASTWNFVLGTYDGYKERVRELQGEGCECGAHGLYHDGKLFADHEKFRIRMQRIQELALELEMRGFRAPALHRDREMLSTIDFDWDSSFPAWDPFQPQPGGCMSYLPFWLSDRTLELPVTLWQDFTLFRELGLSSWEIWKDQLDAIHGAGGLVSIIVHPDYVDTRILGIYGSFLAYLDSLDDILVTTPSKIFQWKQAGN